MLLMAHACHESCFCSQVQSRTLGYLSIAHACARETTDSFAEQCQDVMTTNQ